MACSLCALDHAAAITFVCLVAALLQTVAGTSVVQTVVENIVFGVMLIQPSKWMQEERLEHSLVHAARLVSSLETGVLPTVTYAGLLGPNQGWVAPHPALLHCHLRSEGLVLCE